MAIENGPPGNKRELAGFFDDDGVFAAGEFDRAAESAFDEFAVARPRS